MKKSGAVKRKFRNNKGFTLIEMAIVLVIIGIIIGAVVKGQDLVANANHKKVISAINTWKTLAYAYMDRNGRLPGDAGRNGIIGDNLIAATMPTTTYEQTATTGVATAELVNTMNNAPENPVVIGGLSFWVYFGSATATTVKNAMAICKDAACATVFTADELEVIKTIDTATDGAADAGMGQFRGATAVAGATTLGTVGTPDRASRTFTGATFTVTADATGTPTPWALTDKAAIYLFDRNF